jgi:hypothetical protein
MLLPGLYDRDRGAASGPCVRGHLPKEPQDFSSARRPFELPPKPADFCRRPVGSELRSAGTRVTATRDQEFQAC